MKQSLNKILSCLLAAVLVVSAGGCTLTPASPSTAATETENAASAAPDPVYHDSLTQSPVNWNPQEWVNDADRYILSLTAPGLYAVVAGEDGSYEARPEMAAALPRDVTAEYAGSETYDVPAEAESGYAFRIDLNPAACWSDGTPINADTYLYSMEQMLSSEKKHPRAAAYDSGPLCLANAYDYYMQDQAGLTEFRSLADAGYGSVAEAQNDGIKGLYLDMDSFWGLDCGWVPITSEEAYRDEAVMEGEDEDTVSAKYLYDTYLAAGAPYSAYQTTFVGIRVSRVLQRDFFEVGIIKTGNYQITLVLAKPIRAEMLPYFLTDCFLVRESLYGDAYGTTVNRYDSCGPYVLTGVEPDNLYFSRNDRWYGYTDGVHEGQYGPEAVTCTLFDSSAEALAAFDRQEIDTVHTTEDRDGALRIPETYVSKLSFNTSLAMLGQRETDGVCKTILAYPAFRQAISLCVDRQAFVNACTPTSSPALGLLSDAYVSDPGSGGAYRASDAGKAALADVYGSADATGYDVEKARSFFLAAYDEALADGRMDGSDVIDLEFLVYSDEAVYETIVSFLQQSIDGAVVGSALEGRIHLTKTVDPDYYQTARSGQFELILSTWGGQAADPYGLMSSYCDEDKRFEFGFEPSVEECTLTVDGTPVTRTYRGWYESLTGGRYAAADPALRESVLSGLEAALLARCICVPLYQRTRSVLDGSRVIRTVPAAVPLADTDGVRYVRLADAAPES